MTHLSAGWGGVDITPPGPISLGGFGQRAGDESVGIHDRLSAQALFLSSDKSRLLCVTADVVCIPTDLADAVTGSIVEAGIAGFDEICLTASHTHAGPEVMEFFVRTDTVTNYLAELEERLVAVCKEAVETARPCRVRCGVGEVDFLLNRRTRGAPNRVDGRTFALELQAADGKGPSAVLFGCGCHPVTLGHDNMLISADYPGYARTHVMRRIGAETALFFNMAEGNVIPNIRPRYDSLDTRGYRGGSFEDAETIGRALADAVADSLRHAAWGDALPLGVMKRSLDIAPNLFEMTPEEAGHRLAESQGIIAEYIGDDFTKFTAEDLTPLSTLWRDASREVEERDLSDADMRRLMSAVCTYFVMLQKLFNPAIQERAALPVQVIRLGEYLFIALPGEALVEAGLDWRERNRSRGDDAFVIGLANGYVGYLPHSSNFEEAGAEYKYETIMNALEPRAVDIALDEAVKMAAALFGDA